MTCRCYLWLPALLFLAANSGFSQATNGAGAGHAIGIEGRIMLDLPRPDYRLLPLDDRTELILRIESVSATADHRQRYNFSYIGMEPGDYQLSDYLVYPDGSRPGELGTFRIRVAAVLPESHSGQLTSFTPGQFPFLGGYRVFLGSLGAAWVGGIGIFIWSYRKKRLVVVPVTRLPEPSFAQRMGPLVEAAAAGKLSLDGQAQLERLFIGFWREKLNLPDQRMADALVYLRGHAQAGEFLRALEHWLHQRAGASAAEVSALLEPYRHLPAPAALTGGAT